MPSKVKELADQEAARNEAQPDEGDEPDTDADDDEGAGTDAPGAEPSGDPTAEDMAAFAAEHERHADVLRSIMGADFALLDECDSCGGMGYAPPEQLRPHARYRQCDVCNGFGVVLTGSKMPGNETQACPGCAGRGFQEALTPQPTTATTEPAQANGEQVYGVPPWAGDPNITAQPAFGPPS